MPHERMMARIFAEVDLLLVPPLRDEMLTISNFTGHPSLTMRAGFVRVSEARVPHGVTLLGRLFDEGTVVRAGTRPPGLRRAPRGFLGGACLERDVQDSERLSPRGPEPRPPGSGGRQFPRHSAP